MTAGSMMEKVIIQLNLVTKGFQRGMNRATAATKNVSKGLSDMGNTLAMTMPTWQAANKSVGMGIPEFKRFGKSLPSSQLREFGLRVRKGGTFVDIARNKTISATNAQKRMGQQFNSSGGRVTNAVRHMTHGLRGFRMEMLGTMFFGMMLQNMFLGLLRPVMEAFGVFELFSTMLLVLFLPVMKELFPMILELINKFMELDENVQKSIGYFTLFGVGVGFVLFVIGTFALGIGSVIQILPDLKAGLSKVGVTMKNVKGIFSITGLAITAVLFGIWIAWQENFMNMKEFIRLVWEGIKSIFKGALEIIIGLVNLMTALIKGDFEGVKEALGRIWSGIILLIKGALMFILGFVLSIVVGIVRVITGVVTVLFDLGRAMFRALADGLKSSTEYIKNVVNDIIDWLSRKVRTIIDLFSFGGISASAGGSTKRFNDFIWRPGENPISINPNDTVVGYKGASPLGSGESNITNNFYGFTKDDLNRELDDRDRRVVDEIRRLVKE